MRRFTALVTQIISRAHTTNAEAGAHYETSLQLYEQVEGSDGDHVRQVLESLAEVRDFQGDYTAARQLGTRLRRNATSQNVRLMDASADGDTLNKLANEALEAENYSAAESYYQRTLVLYEQSVGPVQADVAQVLENLGQLYRDQEQFSIKRAEPLFLRALSIRESLYGANNPITAETLSDLSLLYFYEERPAEAVQYGRRALAIQEQTLGKENLDVSTTLNRIGISERDLGQYSQAQTDLKRALAIREKSLDRKHIWIAISLENLASVYIARGTMRGPPRSGLVPARFALIRQGARGTS
jgi:tetratricopeptide (TPR) repeat protein